MKGDSELPQHPFGKASEAEARLESLGLRPDPRRHRESAEEAIKLATRWLRESRRMQMKAVRMRTAAIATRELLQLERHTRRQCLLSDYSNPTLILLDPYLLVGSDLPTILAIAVDAALQLTGADMGNAQLFDPALGALGIEAQRGFEQPFLEFFASVNGGRSACGIALTRAERVIVEDVAKSPIFVGTPALDVMLEAGAHAVQSIPLIGSCGQMLGVLSTHYHQPYHSTESVLRLHELIARVAARWIERIPSPTIAEPL